MRRICHFVRRDCHFVRRKRKVTWYGGKMRNFVATIKDRIMAVQLDKPRRTINVVLRSFARQAVQQLESDFRTQHVYPYEI